MTIRKLKNGDVMVIIPARHKKRWRLLLRYAIEYLLDGEYITYIEKRAAEDAEKLRDAL